MSEYSEWIRIKEFVAECRRQWPGAMIVLRPDTNISPPAGGSADGPIGARAGSVSRQERRKDKKMDIRNYITGSFVSLDDLRDGPRREKIVDVVEGKYDKPNIKFEGGDMVSVNATNGRVLMRAFGPETKTWVGREIELYVGPLEYQGGVQDGVRIRPATAEKAESATEQKPKQTAKPKKPVREEMDDEIPLIKGRRSGGDQPPLLSKMALLDDPKVSLDQAWRELNTRPGRAPTTVEALMYSLRRGTDALSNPDTLVRLAELDDQQLREVMVRLQKLKPEIAREWTSKQVEILAAVRRKSRG